MQFGFELEAAKRDRPDPEAPADREPMRGAHKGEIRRKPSTDQKKTRRALRRSTAATEETSMSREADLLAKMAAAPTLAQQRDLAAELETLRASQRSAAAAEREVDLVDTHYERTFPTFAISQGIQHTGASDWLGEVDEAPNDIASMEASMRAEATVWYDGLHEAIKADADETYIQAVGMGQRLAGAYGPDFAAATEAFTSQVAHLAGLKVSDFGPANPDMVQKPPFNLAEHPVNYPDSKDTFDDSISTPADQKSQSTPSLQEGDTPEGDHAESVNDAPAARGTHDSGSEGTRPSVDYLDGTTTPAQKSSSRATDIIQRIREDLQERPPGPDGRYEPEIIPGVVDVEHGHHRPHILPGARDASRHTAEDQTSRGFGGGNAPSLSEGDAPEGDEAQPVVEDSFGGQSGDADASGGNDAAIDSIDGTTYPKQSLREYAATLGKANISSDALPWLDAMGQLDSIEDSFAGVPGHQIVGYYLKHATEGADVLTSLLAGKDALPAKTADVDLDDSVTFTKDAPDGLAGKSGTVEAINHQANTVEISVPTPDGTDHTMHTVPMSAVQKAAARLLSREAGDVPDALKEHQFGKDTSDSEKDSDDDSDDGDDDDKPDWLQDKIDQGKKSSVTAGMPDVNDIMSWENGEMDPHKEIEFFQGLVNSGMAWRLQGAYGRRAQDLINAGVVHQPHTASVIPAPEPDPLERLGSLLRNRI